MGAGKPAKRPAQASTRSEHLVPFIQLLIHQRPAMSQRHVLCILQVGEELHRHRHASAGVPAGCLITDPDGHTSRRMSMPMKFFSDRENAQHVSLAHGRALVDQQLDEGSKVF